MTFSFTELNTKKKKNHKTKLNWIGYKDELDDLTNLIFTIISPNTTLHYFAKHRLSNLSSYPNDCECTPTTGHFSEVSLKSTLPPSCSKFYYNELHGKPEKSRYVR